MTDTPIRSQSALELLETHAKALEAENERLRVDAERWQALPAFLEKHQIDYVELLHDVDGYRGAHESESDTDHG